MGGQFTAGKYGPARALPFEKGTETLSTLHRSISSGNPRARSPLRRGLKLGEYGDAMATVLAARALPFEKGTETIGDTSISAVLPLRARAPL